MLPEIRGIRALSNVDDLTWIGVVSKNAASVFWQNSLPSEGVFPLAPPGQSPRTISVFGPESATQSFRLNRSLTLSAMSAVATVSDEGGAIHLEIGRGSDGEPKGEPIFKDILSLPEPEKQDPYLTVMFPGGLTLPQGELFVKIRYLKGKLELRTAGENTYSHGELLEHSSDDLLLYFHHSTNQKQP